MTGAEPTVLLYGNDDEIGTAVADSGQAIVTPNAPLQTGGVTARLTFHFGDRRASMVAVTGHHTS